MKFSLKPIFLTGLLCLVFFSAHNLSAGNVMVTLRVNMSLAYPANNVYVGSDWAGWELSKFQKLTDNNNDSIFEITLFLPSGASYNYRFTTSNTNWSGFESLGGTPCGAGPNHEDRNLVVPQTNSVLDVVCFNSCMNCGETPSTMLNLSVDMNGRTVSPNGVHVAGSFNGWNPSSLSMTDENADNVYEITIPVIPNLDYEYNFLNGNTLADAEVVFGICEFRSKRRISVQDENLTAEPVMFGSCNSTGAPITDIKIACIGNSITEGGAGNHVNSWPIQLRDLLGEGYYTENLGVSGTTMLKTGDSPWWNKPQYNYTYSLEPDMVVIKLGTNDSKGGNWNAAKFKADYISMISEFRAMPSHPVIYMATPAKAYSSAYNISDQVIFSQIIPILHEIAFEQGVHLIDFYNPTWNMQANFPDGIHPNAEGLHVIAQKAKENILRAKPVVTVSEASADTVQNKLYQWFRNDVPLAESHRRSMKVTENGNYKVAVRMSNYSNDVFVSEPFAVTIPQGSNHTYLTVDYNVMIGLGQNLNQPVLIYPNPATSTIRIENAGNSDLVIFNNTGKIVMEKKQIEKDQTLNISGLSNGIYHIKLSKGETSLSRQLIVQNQK